MKPALAASIFIFQTLAFLGLCVCLFCQWRINANLLDMMRTIRKTVDILNTRLKRLETTPSGDAL